MVSSSLRVGLFIAIPMYLVILSSVAYWGWTKSKKVGATNSTFVTHYLGGRGFSPLMTAATLYASLFSGYTIIGIPAEAFNTGWNAIRWFLALPAFVGPMILTGLRLRLACDARQHVSPVDFITDRFRSQLVRYMVACIMLAGSLLYLCAQVTATKQMFNFLFNLDDDNVMGVLLIFSLTLVFEWAGGLVSVASTDAVQGFVMLLAYFALPIVVVRNFGGWDELDLESFPRPDFYQTPAPKTQWAWWNFCVMATGLFSVPHFFQRNYAASDVRGLKLGYTFMMMGGLTLILPGIFLGTMTVEIMEGNSPPSSPFAGLLEQVMQLGGFQAAVGVLAFTAALAGIMSTADSLLIAVSQICTMEIIHPLRPNLSKSQQSWTARVVSTVTLGTALAIGIYWKQGIQFAISLQCVPAILTGLFGSGWTDPHPWSIFVGGSTGCIVALALYFGYLRNNSEALPLDNGATGLACNIFLLFLSDTIRRLFFQPQDLNESRSLRLEVNYDSDRPDWDKPDTTRFGSRPLTSRLLKKIMKRTSEPSSSLVLLVVALMTLSLPLTPGDLPPISSDTSKFLYAPATVGGIPYWAAKAMAISSLAYIATFYAIWIISDGKRKSTERGGSTDTDSRSAKSSKVGFVEQDRIAPDEQAPAVSESEE